jgi:hypothetical protein
MDKPIGGDCGGPDHHLNYILNPDEDVFSPLQSVRHERDGNIVMGMPDEEYHADDSIGSTSLKVIMSSAADFKAYRSQPDKGTSAKTFGTVSHTALLEPETYSKRYVEETEYKGSRSTGEGRKQWDAIKKQAKEEGKIPVGFEDAQKINRIRDAASKNSYLSKILREGDPEVSAFYTCPKTKIDYKARADLITSDGFIWDVKTTSKPVDPDGISKTIFNEGYHFQAAHYIWVFEGVGVDITGFGWIVVSTGTPYPHIVLVKASDNLLRAGQVDHKYARETLASCTESDRWPGYPQDVIEIDLPPFTERYY